MTAVLAPALVVNDRYVHRAGGVLQAVHLPGGCWAVKIRPAAGRWIAFAVPLGGNSGAPFVLASGPEADVFVTALRWAESARTLGMRYDRVVFAGYGSALDEQPVDVEALAVAS